MLRSTSQGSPATILAVDLYGTALVLEEVGNVIGAAVPVVIVVVGAPSRNYSDEDAVLGDLSRRAAEASML